MRVKLTVTLDVTGLESDAVLDDKPRVVRSVQEAIENAIRYAQGEGHAHEMSHELSIMLHSIDDANTATISDALSDGPNLTAGIDVQDDKIALSIEDRHVVWLETQGGTPRVLVFADSEDDRATHIIPVKQ